MVTANVRGNRRWLALGALVLGVLAVGLDGTVLNVALPTLASALRASESDLQWFSSAYLLVMAAAILPAGQLGDRYGRKKLLLTGIAIFGTGSFACAYAPSATAFLAARAMLGIGAALMIPLTLSVLTVMFSESERPRAVGIWAGANFLSLPLGPILGGWLLSNFWWGWAFLLNVPVILIGFAVVVLLVPESRSSKRPRLDIPGVLISSAALVLLVYGVIKAGEQGWGSAVALATMLAGALGLVAFVMWERRVQQSRPEGGLVDLRLFRVPSFTWGTVLTGLGIFAMMGVLFTAPQYFQAILGTDAMGSGLRLVPMMLGALAGALPADRLARRIGSKATVTLSFAIMALGFVIGATTSMASGSGLAVLWLAVTGLGIGMGGATAASAALSQLDDDRAGTGSALLQTVQKVGAPFGAALLGSVLHSVYLGRLDLAGLPAAASGVVEKSIFGGIAVAQKAGSAALLHSVQSSFVHGMDAALLASAGVAVVGAALALLFLPKHAVSVESSEANEIESAHGYVVKE